MTNPNTKEQFLNLPIQENVCQNLTFEQAIQLRDALSVRTLDCTVTIQDRDGYVSSLTGVNTDTYKLYSEIKRYGSVITLAEAAGQGQFEKVKFLLKLGVPVNAQDKSGSSILEYAIDGDQIFITKFLIEQGANPTLANRVGKVPLYFAIVNQNLELVQMLVGAGANPRIVDTSQNGHNALTLTARDANLDIIKYLLPFFDINAIAPNLLTPILSAVEAAPIETIRFLLEEGADPTVTTQSGDTLLYKAVERGDLDLVQLILETGIDPNQTGANGWSPLSLTVGLNFDEIAQRLIAAGADLNPNTPLNPLAVAASKNYLLMAKMLIEEGADVNSIDLTGNPILITTVSNNLTEMSKLLIFSNANVNVRGNLQLTPLLWAVDHENEELVKELIEVGANLFDASAGGVDALAVALNHKNERIRQILLEAIREQYGYDQYLKNSNRK